MNDARDRIAEAAHEAIAEAFGGLGWGETYYEDGHKEEPDTELAYHIADQTFVIIREELLNKTMGYTYDQGRVVVPEDVAKVIVGLALREIFSADDDGGQRG